MRDGINESVVLLVASNLTYKESGIENDADDDHHEENDAKNQEGNLSPVKENPSDVQSDRQGYKEGAECDEEDYRFTATTDSHATIVRPGRGWQEIEGEQMAGAGDRRRVQVTDGSRIGRRQSAVDIWPLPFIISSRRELYR